MITKNAEPETRLPPTIFRLISILVALFLVYACSPTRLRSDLPEATYYTHPFNIGKKGSKASFEVEAVYCNSHDIRFGVVMPIELRQTLLDLSDKIPYSATQWPHGNVMEVPQVNLIISNSKKGEVLQNTTNDVFGISSHRTQYSFTRAITSINKPGIYRIEIEALKSVAQFDNELNSIEISIYSKIEKTGAEKCTN